MQNKLYLLQKDIVLTLFLQEPTTTSDSNLDFLIKYGLSNGQITSSIWIRYRNDDLIFQPLLNFRHSFPSAQNNVSNKQLFPYRHFIPYFCTRILGIRLIVSIKVADFINFIQAFNGNLI